MKKLYKIGLFALSLIVLGTVSAPLEANMDCKERVTIQYDDLEFCELEGDNCIVVWGCPKELD